MHKNKGETFFFPQKKEAEAWVLPIIQGFVQIEPCQVEVGFESQCSHYEVRLFQIFK